MKKKIAILICFSLIMLLTILLFTACDADEHIHSYEEHVHSYSVRSTDSKYLATVATCENSATYYYSCSCGAKGTTTFASGNAKGHNYTVQSTNSKYLATAATCENSATYYYSCSCGAKGAATFASGNAKGHKWETDGLTRTCTGCFTTQGYDIQIPDTPMTFSSSYARAEITSITVKSVSWGLGTVDMNVYTKKTYQQYGSQSVSINYKLYDSNNVVVDDGTVLVSLGDAVGDTALKVIYLHELSLGESYRLEFYK